MRTCVLEDAVNRNGSGKLLLVKKKEQVIVGYVYILFVTVNFFLPPFTAFYVVLKSIFMAFFRVIFRCQLTYYCDCTTAEKPRFSRFNIYCVYRILLRIYLFIIIVNSEFCYGGGVRNVLLISARSVVFAIFYITHAHIICVRATREYILTRIIKRVSSTQMIVVMCLVFSPLVCR